MSHCVTAILIQSIQLFYHYYNTTYLFGRTTYFCHSLRDTTNLPGKWVQVTLPNEKRNLNDTQQIFSASKPDHDFGVRSNLVVQWQLGVCFKTIFSIIRPIFQVVKLIFSVIKQHTIFIVINAPGRCIFQKGGRLLQINKIISRVQWPWAIMDTCCLDLAGWHV